MDHRQPANNIEHFSIFVDLLMMLMVVTTVISGITIVTEALKRWSDDERI